MANKKSAKKRILTNEKSRQKNSQVKSSIRTAVKKVLNILSSKENIEGSNLADLQKNFQKTIDTACCKGIIKKNTAARKKSRIIKKINAAQQA